MGYDTECDLSLEAVGPGSAKNRAEIIRLRDKLLVHWLGCLEKPFQQAVAEHGGVGAALDALRLAGHCRLRPIAIEKLNPGENFVADNHLGDPLGEYDAWWPWRRKRAVADRRQALKALAVETDKPITASRPSATGPAKAKSARKRRIGEPT